MPNRSDLLLSNLEELQQNLTDLWRTLTRDPAKEARKERAWTILAGAFTALGAIAARRVATKAWGVLTGETPPVGKQPARPSPSGPSTRGVERPQAEAETEAERAPTAAGA